MRQPVYQWKTATWHQMLSWVSTQWLLLQLMPWGLLAHLQNRTQYYRYSWVACIWKLVNINIVVVASICFSVPFSLLVDLHSLFFQRNTGFHRFKWPAGRCNSRLSIDGFQSTIHVYLLLIFGFPQQLWCFVQTNEFFWDNCKIQPQALLNVLL